MVSRAFLKSGHTPTLLSAFLYFDLSFMTWVLLGPLGVAIAKDFGLTPAQKGLMVAIPVLSGAILRLVAGLMVDHIGPKKTGIIGQLVVLLGLGVAWFLGVHNYHQVLTLGVVLGVAGASFAVALPLASRWYPPEHQGLALGIAGAGNSGTALAALFAPGLAQMFGWQNVIGLAALPLVVALAVFIVFAKDAPNRPPPKTLAEYLSVLKTGDAWWLMGLYSVTFGGFVGLSSSLTIYFNAEYGMPAVQAGFFTAACVFAGSFLRPVGGGPGGPFRRGADAVGGLRPGGPGPGAGQLPAAQPLDRAGPADVRHDGAGRRQRGGLPAGPPAVRQGDRRGHRTGGHDRRGGRLLPGLEPGLGQAGDGGPIRPACWPSPSWPWWPWSAWPG